MSFLYFFRFLEKHYENQGLEMNKVIENWWVLNGHSDSVRNIEKFS